MSERRPQEIRKDPKTGGYPIIKGFFNRKIVQTDPEPIPEYREPSWSNPSKGQMVAVYLIAIIFAVMVIAAVFS